MRKSAKSVFTLCRSYPHDCSLDTKPKSRRAGARTLAPPHLVRGQSLPLREEKDPPAHAAQESHGAGQPPLVGRQKQPFPQLTEPRRRSSISLPHQQDAGRQGRQHPQEHHPRHEAAPALPPGEGLPPPQSRQGGQGQAEEQKQQRQIVAASVVIDQRGTHIEGSLAPRRQPDPPQRPAQPPKLPAPPP